MGGEGSMLHMINTLKNNRNLRRSKRRKFRNDNTSSSGYHRNKFVSPDISDEKLKSIKEDIRRRVKREKLRNALIGGIVFSVFGLLIVYLWFFIL